MKSLILLLAIVCFVNGQVINNLERLTDLGFDLSQYNPDTLEDAFLTTSQLATKNGYNVEIHTVTTKDGYILEMHRIQSRSTSKPSRKAPIFILHGLQYTSEIWVIAGPKYGLAYLLADMGYDVWLGNSRGNHYSLKHIKLNPNGDEFERKNYWSFSWNEIGIYDVPTMIDKVLETTNSKKLHYIGYSQGTTAFWVMASELPKYNDKIIMMHAFTPVAFLSNPNSGIYALMAPILNNVPEGSDPPLDIPADTDILMKYGLNACSDKIGNEKYGCANQVHLLKIGGYTSTEQINTIVPVAINHVFGGAAVKCFLHYGQLLANGKFCKYDYGWLNIFKYLKFSPPEYKLKKISTPIALYYGNGDDVSTVKDIEKLINVLPNVFKQYLVKDTKFNHFDFIFSPSVVDLVYKELFTNLQLAEDMVV